MYQVCDYEGSSMWGMNGGQPESPDRQWFVGDCAYPGYPADIFLYRRGETVPAATFGGQNFQHCIWDLKVHPNPTFSRDGKRIYFNHPVSDGRTVACFVRVEEL